METNEINKNNIESIPEITPVFNSLEELRRYFYKEIAEEEEKWGIFYPLIFKLELFISRIKMLKKKTVWAFQRIIRKHHASDVDLYRLDFHIAKMLLSKLEAFRNQSLHISPTGEIETWLNILDEIIYAFKWNIYANWERNPQKERDFYLSYFGIDDPNLDYLYYYDSEIVKNAAIRAQKGFELFGKYFTSLWNY